MIFDVVCDRKRNRQRGHWQTKYMLPIYNYHAIDRTMCVETV